MTTREGYTRQQAARDYLRDVATEIRCARRDGMPEYAAQMVAVFRRLWPHRAGITDADEWMVVSGQALASTLLQ